MVPNAEPLGKCLFIMIRNFLATLVLTSSFHGGGLNQITFLLRDLFLATVFSVYWSSLLYLKSFRALLYTATSDLKTSLLKDDTDLLFYDGGVLGLLDGAGEQLFLDARVEGNYDKF